jgi:hypothetical protein
MTNLKKKIRPGAGMFFVCRKKMRKHAKINRSNRWAIPEAITTLAKIKSEQNS